MYNNNWPWCITQCNLHKLKLLYHTFFNYVYATVLPPTIAPTLNEVIPSSSTSCTVIWTINNTNYDIILILTNLLTGEINIVTVTEYTVNTNIYNVTERLNGVDNYNVSVATINACGRMMSDTVTVYGKNYST